MGTRWHPAQSDIHGLGAFASEPIQGGEMVDYLVKGLRAGGLLGGDRSKLGELVNHQSRPNGRMERVPSRTDQYYFRSLSDIEPDSELTIDYNDTPFFVAKPHQVDPGNFRSWG
ncbi:MAG: SET domain-containing protein-lysine N-methyltransferase [Planctomycetes bacterium]|nr:SET domain-containing protein-lysine N-methyltransferase [Planctomycetota bacterium]